MDCEGVSHLRTTRATTPILYEDRLAVRVLDCYSVKRIDTEALPTAVAATGGRLCVVEDHSAAGGLGERHVACTLDALVVPAERARAGAPA